jgi:hypothetical protein
MYSTYAKFGWFSTLSISFFFCFFCFYLNISVYLSIYLFLSHSSPSPCHPFHLLYPSQTLIPSHIPQGAPLEAAFQREWLEEEIEQAKLCATQVMIFTAHPWFLKQIIEDKEDGEEMLR